MPSDTDWTARIAEVRRDGWSEGGPYRGQWHLPPLGQVAVDDRDALIDELACEIATQREQIALLTDRDECHCWRNHAYPGIGSGEGDCLHCLEARIARVEAVPPWCTEMANRAEGDGRRDAVQAYSHAGEAVREALVGEEREEEE